jgi:murein DD-endopeptidase MepM/ murein hydrolase activator NlpD
MSEINGEDPKIAATPHNGDSTNNPDNESLTRSEEEYLEERQPSQKHAGTIIQKIGLNMLVIGVLAFLAFIAWQKFTPGQNSFTLVPRDTEEIGSQQEEAPDAPEYNNSITLTPFATPQVSSSGGIFRKVDLKTIIPSRPRDHVITYTVEAGDTLFSIAESFNLKPETVLWGNFEVLEDNPHLLRPDQSLNILPINGTYYQWKDGDNLDAMAGFFQVDKQEIINFSGNNFDLVALESGESPIEPGTWLMFPGGKRAIKDWGPPAISRTNAASAQYYGDGHCGDVYEGAFGTGTYVWPTTERFISGYPYDGNIHPAVDIGGQLGNSVFATDSGVVVFAGWSNYGYGYMIVVDHGNGWQSAYAHLSAVGVGCGQSVYQGGHIGALGSSGNSSGPHLHFELGYNGVKVSPLDYLQ